MGAPLFQSRHSISVPPRRELPANFKSQKRQFCGCIFLRKWTSCRAMSRYEVQSLVSELGNRTMNAFVEGEEKIP
jgi:hypothetical protein